MASDMGGSQPVGKHDENLEKGHNLRRTFCGDGTPDDRCRRRPRPVPGTAATASVKFWWFWRYSWRSRPLVGAGLPFLAVAYGVYRLEGVFGIILNEINILILACVARYQIG
jgi:hypothetical protein